ncbi:unnamed protein product [Rotaria sp. Silwood2]|nr:unnamed protein product [Rotaria sp. Silwood2]CAF4063475.1 unnamed protein product [Rotaria sp. Silwood2]CAF4505548.1 unnamed protein product [Rotaria sp. Silwood2]
MPFLTVICNSNPCYNFGECISINGNLDYYCICPPNLPVGGKRCDQLITETTTTTMIPTTIYTPSPCASNPCYNDGVCSVSPFTNTYVCSCSQAYYGKQCESLNRCFYQSGVCQNGGTCVSLNGNTNYYCQCPQEYTGRTCDTAVTICPVDYCKNNGQCSFDYTLNRLRCACPGTFSGQYCQIPIGEANACASFPCYNNGSCTPAGASFLCTCKEPFSGNQCQIKNNTSPNTLCDVIPGICKQGSTCISNGTHIQCICRPGTEGEFCEKTTTSKLNLDRY